MFFSKTKIKLLRLGYMIKKESKSDMRNLVGKILFNKILGLELFLRYISISNKFNSDVQKSYKRKERYWS